MKITLNKTEDGKKLIWSTTIQGSTFTTTFGQEGGKMQILSKTITDSKNEGKANFSSTEDQAINIIVNKALGKIRRGYEIIEGSDIVKQYTGKEVKEVFYDVPEPTLANDGTKRFKYIKEQPCIITQFKLDGFRGISNGVGIYSRSRKEFTGKVPHLIPHINDIIEELGVDWIDGELFSDDITFNEIQSIMLKKPTTMTAEDVEKAKSIKFNMFDYISDEPQIERTKKLMTLKGNEYVKIVASLIVQQKDITEEYIQALHNDAVEKGNEGIMIRFPNEPYMHKRTNSLLKWKMFKDLEATIVGITPERNDKTKLGAMVMDLNGNIFNARPAMTDKEKAEIFANPSKYIGQLGVIKYQDLDANTGTPRFPVFKGLRSKIDLS